MTESGLQPDSVQYQPLRRGYKAGFWWHKETWYCSLCGKTTTYNTRVYGPKPAEYEKRNEVKEVWDYCGI